MLYLENNTTFSGSDIRVYVYRDAEDLKTNYRDKVDGNRVQRTKEQHQDPVNPFDPNPFDNIPLTDMNDIVDAKTKGLTSDSFGAINTSKVNTNYIDIVKQGSDRQAIELARKYQNSKLQTTMNRNALEGKDGKTYLKPIIELGSIYSITYSSFREKIAVRTLGRVSAKGYTRGQRTIAGSMNFTIFQSHELMDFLRKPSQASDIVLLDQLPKFNIMLLMINEYGGASILHLFNVTISTESQQTSVEDLALMNQVSFYAEDIMTVENVGNLFETSLSMLHPTVLAGRSLQFYNKNQPTTLEDLFEMNSGETGKVQNYINRSRGLF